GEGHPAAEGTEARAPAGQRHPLLPAGGEGDGPPARAGVAEPGDQAEDGAVRDLGLPPGRLRGAAAHRADEARRGAGGAARPDGGGVPGARAGGGGGPGDGRAGAGGQLVAHGAARVPGGGGPDAGRADPGVPEAGARFGRASGRGGPRRGAGAVLPRACPEARRVTASGQVHASEVFDTSAGASKVFDTSLGPSEVFDTCRRTLRAAVLVAALAIP